MFHVEHPFSCFSRRSKGVSQNKEKGVAYIICISNQKGGVGKTTTSVNLSSGLVRIGKKVLLVDMDPQGNASSGLGIGFRKRQQKNIYRVLIGHQSFNNAICQTSEGTQLSIVPACSDLVGAETELMNFEGKQFLLKKALQPVKKYFDYILIDCPPSLSLLTVNALTSAHSFLVPLQCEYYALEGLSQLLTTVGLLKKNLNPQLELEGIVLTMFDRRNNLSHQVVEEAQKHFKQKVFQTIIPRNIRLSEAPSYGKSVHNYAPRSIGARRYKALALELEKRFKLKKEFKNFPPLSQKPPSVYLETKGESHV